MEDNLRWKKTFGGRGPLVEDDLQWKKTFSGRQPSVGDDLQWKMTFGGGRPLMEDDLMWKIIMDHILISNFQLAQKEIQGNILIIKRRTTSLTTFVVVQ